MCTKCCQCLRNSKTTTLCVLQALALVALIIYISLHYCLGGGKKDCKKDDETNEEYVKRKLTSAEKNECSGKNISYTALR